MTRRDFVQLAGRGAMALAAVGTACRNRPAAPAADPRRSPSAAGRKLEILVLGGTGFLGPDVVRVAKGRGHALTLFNRGKTNPHLFPDVEKLHGDRDGGLDPLRGRRWDAVVDTSGYVPRVVRQSAELLAPSVRRYLFVSSISAYAAMKQPGITEEAAVAQLPPDDPGTEDVRAHYGALKAACERTVEETLPERALVVRPGLIVGPGDPTDRFTYWPVRLSQGGEVLAPGDGQDPVQLVDVRDLAAFLVKLLEDDGAGKFNAAGPRGRLTMREMLEGCRSAASADSRLVWVDQEFLEARGVEPWSDLPVWVPRTSDLGGLAQVNVERAVAAGLTFRPLATTARDTLDWWGTLPAQRRDELRAGITRERENDLLTAWKSRGT